MNPNNLELDHVPQFGKHSRLSVSNNSSKSDNQYNKSDHSTREQPPTFGGATSQYIETKNTEK